MKSTTFNLILFILPILSFQDPQDENNFPQYNNPRTFLSAGDWYIPEDWWGDNEYLSEARLSQPNSLQPNPEIPISNPEPQPQDDKTDFVPTISGDSSSLPPALFNPPPPPQDEPNVKAPGFDTTGLTPPLMSQPPLQGNQNSNPVTDNNPQSLMPPFNIQPQPQPQPQQGRNPFYNSWFNIFPPFWRPRPNPNNGDLCNKQRYQFLIGSIYDEKSKVFYTPQGVIQAASLPKDSRTIGPGTAVTLDLRTNRLNIVYSVDPYTKQNKVTGLNCG